MAYEILCGSSVALLKQMSQKVDFTFLDPPFNQQKDYALHNDDMPQEQYWAMMKDVCQSVFNMTNKGGCIYFFYATGEKYKICVKYFARDRLGISKFDYLEKVNVCCSGKRQIWKTVSNYCLWSPLKTTKTKNNLHFAHYYVSSKP